MASRSIVVILALAGCGATSRSGSSGRPLECHAVISSLLARSQAFASQVFGDRYPYQSRLVGDVIEAVTPAFVQSCRDDRWSAELLGCLDQMTVTDDPHKCNHLFTTDQAVGLARRTLTVMEQWVHAEHGASTR
jgi:hypothetical protein